MLNLPVYIPALMLLATAIALYFFYEAVSNKKVTYAVITWIVIQGIIASTGFYTKTDTIPPRFVLVLLPPIVTIILLFSLPKGRTFINNLHSKNLTYLHTSRIFVELVIWWLFLSKLAPEDITFEGNNFDILAGLTAPFIAYFGIHKKLISNKLILIWNVICLGLLLNVVITGVLSSPLPFQQFNFAQPNVGMLYFPYVFIPGVVVQLVLFSHLVEIRRLLRN
ncbi:MAG: hypothetical protein NWQ46_00935 [Spirosomaceae bacterium]|nr:hypothetical protein [Spirosomataceae bacterium]